MENKPDQLSVVSFATYIDYFQYQIMWVIINLEGATRNRGRADQPFCEKQGAGVAHTSGGFLFFYRFRYLQNMLLTHWSSSVWQSLNLILVQPTKLLDRVNCADSAFIIFELLYNCFKNMPHVFFCYFVVCSVFLYLCTCIFVFACLTYGNIICDIL